MMLQGCKSQPTISEVQTKLQVQTEVAKINSNKDQLLVLKDSLNKIPSKLIDNNPVKPEPQLPQLELFLEDNDCLNHVNYEVCYKETRLKLIRATYELDEVKDINYAQKVSIIQLIKNLNLTIDTIAAK